MTQNTEERIAKVMARIGTCSRRDAEQWIAAGRVKVNDVLVTQPGTKVKTEDEIKVDDKILPSISSSRLWLYHKPRGLITTHKDPEDRPTVFNTLPKNLPRVVSVGRLDVNSEGLLLLTNDGELARFFELPKTQIPRTYRVRVFGQVTDRMIEMLNRGLTIEGISYGSIKAHIDERMGANVWLTLRLYEGKNREIRKIIQYFDLSLSRLIRVAYGPFVLNRLLPEHVYEVPELQLKQDLQKLKYL